MTLEDLGRECDVIIRNTTTAIFQSGRPDTVFVLMSVDKVHVSPP